MCTIAKRQLTISKDLIVYSVKERDIGTQSWGHVFNYSNPIKFNVIQKAENPYLQDTNFSPDALINGGYFHTVNLRTARKLLKVLSQNFIYSYAIIECVIPAKTTIIEGENSIGYMELEGSKAICTPVIKFLKIIEEHEGEI